ncbi:recombinase family protein [Enterococcus sp. BWM-S5]|uniref:Recombinase family protein n=1 Tax=Enterococcus larvae TaxID=2794352 RepID=A0ABS4CHW3_9ENTE|nr:recombinase family protein [Enterococcus larvae]MBP1046216.1 recombinase family protein [Enterococcus larvae]
MNKKKRTNGILQNEIIAVGYARVSSLDDRQKLGMDVQLEALKNCSIIFSEKQSGDNDNRHELAKALSLAKELAQQGNRVSLQIYKLDRLTRKMFTLASIIDDLNNHNVRLISLQENIETDSLTGRLLCLVLGYVAEIELNNIRLRTKEGLRKAKENGKKLGNQGLSKKKERKIIKLYQSNDLTIREIAKHCSVCEATVYNVAKRNGLSRTALIRPIID